MRFWLHRTALRVFRRLPRPVRRWTIRGVWPKYTVGALCLLERDDGALLLIRHVYRPRWGAPGGLLSRRERPEDGVRREVREEIGVEVELVGEPAVVVDPRVQRIDVVFRGRLIDPTAEPHPVSPEVTTVQWFPREALPELQRELTEALVAMARLSNAPIMRPVAAADGGAGRRADLKAMGRG